MRLIERIKNIFKKKELTNKSERVAVRKNIDNVSAYIIAIIILFYPFLNLLNSILGPLIGSQRMLYYDGVGSGIDGRLKSQHSYGIFSKTLDGNSYFYTEMGNLSHIKVYKSNKLLRECYYSIIDGSLESSVFYKSDPIQETVISESRWYKRETQASKYLPAAIRLSYKCDWLERSLGNDEVSYDEYHKLKE